MSPRRGDLVIVAQRRDLFFVIMKPMGSISFPLLAVTGDRAHAQRIADKWKEHLEWRP